MARGFLGLFRPLGATFTGLLAGFFSSALVTLVVTSVYEPGSLQAIGWTTAEHVRFSRAFFEDVFINTRFGWAYLCSGTFLGLGLAMMTNRLRASGKWEEFLVRQSRITSFGEAFSVVRSTTAIAVGFCLPLVVSLALGGVAEYLICNPPVGGQSKWDDWQNPNLFLALSIAGDLGSKLFGGVFGIAGMGLLAFFPLFFQAEP